MTNLKDLSRFQKSIHPKELQDDKILNSQPIKEEKTSNSMFAIEQIDTEKFKGIYLVSIVAWGFDDVSEIYHAFAEKADAESCFAYYNRPISEIVNELTPPPVTIIKGDQKKHINGDEHQGYVVMSRYGGEVLIPFFASDVLKENGWFEDEAIRKPDVDIRELIGTKYEIALVRYDRVVGGVKAFRETTVNFRQYTCWETGLKYLTLAYKYPDNIFSVMKPYLQFHSEEIEEEGNWKGWYVIRDTEEFNKLKQGLENIGWTINYASTASDDD